MAAGRPNISNVPSLTSSGRAVLRGPGATEVALVVNGEAVTAQVAPRRTLLDTLRETLALTGTKKVCDEGTCGAWTVLVDGRPVYSCMTLVIPCQAMSIGTNEAVSNDGEVRSAQRAFIVAETVLFGVFN